MWQVHLQWLLVAVATLLFLGPQSTVAANYEELEDVPHVNFDTLFRAYISLGDALFGTWTPPKYAEELQHLRTDAA